MEKYYHEPPPHATTTGTASTGNRALENLKSLLIKCAIASTPAESLSLPQKTFIEKRIQDFFPTANTPDHPPYAWMIENAIKQLNEEGGSSEKAISKFIVQVYKDLPWAHAALLRHHLKKLSECGNLIKSHKGCYFIDKESVSHCSPSNPSLRLICTTSFSPSPSSSPSSGSSSSYASTSTSSSSLSFNLNGKHRKKRNCKKNRTTQWRKQNATGIKICGWGRGRGRGRVQRQGSGRGRHRSYGNPYKNMRKKLCKGQVEDDSCIRRVEAIERQYVMIEDESAEENIRGKEQPQERGCQYNVNFERQAQQSMVIEIESSEHEYEVNEEGNKPLQQNNGASIMEGEIQYTDQVEQDEGDSMDELIDEVCREMKDATKTQYLMIYDEAAEINLELNEHRQMSLHLKKKQLESEHRKLRSHPTNFQSEAVFDLPSPEKSLEANQRRELKRRPFRNESTEVANRPESLAARPEHWKRKAPAARRSLRL